MAPTSGTTPGTLFVWGDSFAGPLSLMHTSVVKVARFRGASARGLANPNATLQVAPQIRAYLDDPVARPRKVFLVFGNVDLHVHFLYQRILRDPAKQSQNRDDPPADGSRRDRLGPADWGRFVWESYRSWLEQEIVSRLQLGENQSGDPRHTIEDVFIAAAVLPCVSDEHLAASVTAYTGLVDGRSGPLPDDDDSAPRTDVAPTVGPSSLVRWPPLPSIGERCSLVQTYNTLLKDYCDLHRLRTRLHYVDINPILTRPPEPSPLFPSGPLPPTTTKTTSMHPSATARSGTSPSSTASLPVPVHPAFLNPQDPTNIHPVWERSLPLWIAALSSIRRPSPSADGKEMPVIKINERHVRVNLENREANWLRKGRSTTHVRVKDLRRMRKRKRDEDAGAEPSDVASLRAKD